MTGPLYPILSLGASLLSTCTHLVVVVESGGMDEGGGKE